MIFKGPIGHAPVSEADIQAYTDGSIAGDRAFHVRHYLAARPAEWRRVLFYRRLNAQIRRSFPGPERGQEPGARRAAWRIGLRGAIAALALAVALAGAAAGWLTLRGPTPPVLNAAAIMALMEAANPATDGEPASAGIGAAEPFDLKAAGLRLVSEGTLDLGPFASARRYVYENGDGKKVVLLGARAWFAPDEPQWSARRFGMLRLIGWTSHGTRWVLAGNAQTHGLMRAADVATMPPGNNR